MPNENEPKSQNLSPDKIDAGKNGAASTKPEKGFLNAAVVIFKNFLPALLAAFAMGRETFKIRIRGVPTTDKTESAPAQNASQGAETPEGETPLPQKQSGFFKSKLTSFKQKVSSLNPFRKPAASVSASSTDSEGDESKGDGENEEVAPVASSKKRNFILAFSIALIITISVCGGLYLGGMFDKDTAAENGNPAAAAPQKNSADAPKKSLFDSVFGKKNKAPATPKEKLEAMRITYNANNFVKYAGQNEMQVVRLFIEAGMHPDVGRTVDGSTPLMAAATYNRSKIAEFLLQKGADINAQDTLGQTALMKAVRYNRPFMASMLLKNNANYHIADIEGHTAISLAKEYAVDNRMAEVFADFDVNISDAKKESRPAKALESMLPPSSRSSVPTPVPGPAPGRGQPKKSPYLEVSVQELLKMIEPESASEPTSGQAPQPKAE